MHFEHSEKTRSYLERIKAFMAEHVYPNESTFEEQIQEDPWSTAPIVEELKAKAQAEGLWNLFLPSLRDDEPAVDASPLVAWALADVGVGDVHAEHAGRHVDRRSSVRELLPARGDVLWSAGDRAEVAAGPLPGPDPVGP